MINQETNKQLTSKNYQYSNFDAYIVGCFTDCLVAPPYVLSYLNNYPQAFLKNKYVLTFNEHGGDGGSVQHNLHQLFLRNEAKPVSHIKINYCNNYIGLTYPKNELEIQGIKRDQLAQVHPKCVLYNNLLQNKAQYVFPKQSCGPRFGSFLTTPLFKKITNVMSMKYTVNDNCTGCSTCVDNCPQAIIELIEGKAAFTNEKRCIGCYLLRLPVQAEPNYQRDDHLAHAPLRSERSQRKSAAPRKGSSRKSVRPGFEINGGRRYATERHSGYRRTKQSKLHVSEGSQTTINQTTIEHQFNTIIILKWKMSYLKLLTRPKFDSQWIIHDTQCFEVNFIFFIFNTIYNQQQHISVKIDITPYSIKQYIKLIVISNESFTYRGGADVTRGIYTITLLTSINLLPLVLYFMVLFHHISKYRQFNKNEFQQREYKRRREKQYIIYLLTTLNLVKYLGYIICYSFTIQYFFNFQILKWILIKYIQSLIYHNIVSQQ
ncbi:4Fe-4S_ferredoxin iron-sulfur binding domain protein [Hexamita inflata]|uniref:4Fe-4S ferredoxin iron-sulfur binding domain protein n=1 Tax=Hexamita inflata TaxID=28002 RepID=A0AA86Q5L7_9EUKA|nr:4Fe-4S ferredoxin iron-sulfur binding domain protein [Hexamita inflata]